jgi:hypothetical protein
VETICTHEEVAGQDGFIRETHRNPGGMSVITHNLCTQPQGYASRPVDGLQQNPEQITPMNIEVWRMPSPSR